VELTCASTAVCLVAFAGISARSIRFNDNICLGVEAPALREDKLQNNKLTCQQIPALISFATVVSLPGGGTTRRA